MLTQKSLKYGWSSVTSYVLCARMIPKDVLGFLLCEFCSSLGCRFMIDSKVYLDSQYHNTPRSCTLYSNGCIFILTMFCWTTVLSNIALSLFLMVFIVILMLFLINIFPSTFSASDESYLLICECKSQTN